MSNAAFECKNCKSKFLAVPSMYTRCPLCSSGVILQILEKPKHRSVVIDIKTRKKIETF